MATNYPGSLDTSTQQPSPSASTEMDDAGYEHDAVHTNHSGAIIALETKVGTGDSNAVANSVLAGTGSGTSGWTTTPTVTGLTVNGDTSSTGHFTAQSGGADGGIVLGQTYATDYVGLRTAGMGEASANEYVIMSNGTTTFISAGTGGDVYIRAGANSSSCQIVLDSDQDDIDIAGDVAIAGRLDVGNGSGGDYEIRIYKADNNVSDHIQFYNGTTRIGEIGCEDSTWLRINQETAKNIYTPRLLRADGGFQAGNGSAATPAYSFQGDSNTGFFITGNNGNIRWSGNGTEGGRLWSTGTRVVNGSAGTPSYAFTSDTDTGMYRNTTNQVSLTAGGTVGLICASGTVNTAGLSTSSTSGYRYVMRNSTYGTLYHYTSSADVKENITNVTASDAAAWIDSLQPVTYNEKWLQDGTESEEDRAFREADIQVGFIADDVLANSTSAKFAQVENVDGTLKGVGWKWECVIAAAVAEIKSLRARVADLEAA